jgi:hypothetical protein
LNNTGLKSDEESAELAVSADAEGKMSLSLKEAAVVLGLLTQIPPSLTNRHFAMLSSVLQEADFKSLFSDPKFEHDVLSLLMQMVPDVTWG